MRILYLTYGFPYPLTSGYLRHYFLIKELSSHHDVVLLSVVSANFDPENIEALAPFTERVFTFTSTNKGTSFTRKAINRIISFTGIGISDEAVRKMREKVEALVGGERFDLVFFSGKRTFSAIKDLEGLPLVVDMCDATSMHIRGKMRYVNRLRLPFLFLEYKQVAGIESALMKKASHILFASRRDQNILHPSSDDRATVIPNGVDLDYWKRETTQRGKDTIVFTGSMAYPPNTDAALYLIEEIYPLVRESVPGAKIFVVGRDPAPSLIKAGQIPGVTVTGFVDDVRPYLEQASVFVVPLRFGAGIQNKVLEAMAMEVPVIASPLAAEGLYTEKDERPPLLIAENKREFAKLIVAELRKLEQQPDPDVVSRRFIEENFMWKRSGYKVESIFSQLTGCVDS